MVIEGLHSSQINRESPIRPQLDRPEIEEALRHGNIYDVLRTPGIDRRDVEEFLAGQWQVFHNQLVQDYEVYAAPASIPSIQENNIADLTPNMHFTQEERQFFAQEMSALQQVRESASPAGATPVRGMGSTVRGMGVDRGDLAAKKDLMAIGEASKQDWDAFFNELQMKAIDARMYQDLASRSKELEREVSRIIAMVRAGIADPEYVIIAATKANMLPNGIFFKGSAEKIMHMNENMNKIAKDIYKLDTADTNKYTKELQMAQARTRSGQTDMQMETMNLQKFAGNVATTLEWANGAIRMMQEMRRTTTQNLAAR